MIRRPKPTDTEEEILALQEAFLASKKQPSAAVQVSKIRAGDKRGGVDEQDPDDRGDGMFRCKCRARKMV